ncbi:SGNH/GDSL hydrolase family protein [Arthrobacter sp. 92]|uniref:SGNH/GDSL hydrolase family protein n=1 Tax=Arthrobacter sp. 92 TaxID=3418175 RepID=UPI003D03A64B
MRFELKYVWLAVLAAATVFVVAVALKPGAPSADAAAVPKSTAPVATPTASVAPVVVSVLSDSHAFNAGSWFRQTVEAGTIPGVRLGAFASQPGASATVLTAKLDEAAASKGIVIVQAGTNDLLSAVGADRTAANVEDLIDGVKARGAKPVVALIPPSAKRGPEVLDTNKLLTAYATANKIGLLDVTTAVETPGGQWKDGLSDDGVHANQAGAKLMADAAAQQIPVLIR